MNYLLLLGAGFSHNWGGWLASEAFEYLLGVPEIIKRQRIRRLLWEAKQRGEGFEGALGDLQDEHERQPSPDNLDALATLEWAIGQMLDDMNRGFLQRNFEFQNQVAYLVGAFLARFDAIFTLNQDLLLEHHYMSNDSYFIAPSRRWDAPALPGMFAHRTREHVGQAHWSGPTWEPTDPTTIGIPARSQPYYKLHGSSNWRTAIGKRLLVAGGNKTRTIRSLEILQRYLEEFERRLAIPETRLMVIGYGFRDDHINQAIKQATARSGLEVYIVDTRGTDAIEGLSLEEFVCGASRRPLSATFGEDTIEHAKLMRFFGGPSF